MNNFKRRKLGIPPIDKTESEKLKKEIQNLSPVSFNKAIKEPLSYSQQNIKTVNIGTLKNPKEVLVVSSNDGTKYNPVNVETKNSLFYESSSVVYNTYGELANFTPKLSFIDQNNPYDPLFSSFSRLTSFPTKIVVVSGVTGIIQGDQEKFYSLSSGFAKSENIEIRGAGSNLNGVYIPSGTSLNRTRYVNTSLPLQAEIAFSPLHFNTITSGGVTYNIPVTSGWIIRQRRSVASLALFPRYYLTGNYKSPTGSNWVRTGSLLGGSGFLPTPTGYLLETEGFFKLAATRVSDSKNIIYGTGINNTGVSVGNTSGNKPNGSSWVTYPHTYFVTKFPAFNYELVVVPDLLGPINFANNIERHTGINDLLIISTGYNEKKIVYVSPHKIYNFIGFWSEASGTNRIPVTGSNGSVISTRPIFVLRSGNLLGLSSEEAVFTGLSNSYFGSITGSGDNQNATIRWYNLDQSRLKQSTPLKDTLFYKLYEPIYQKNGIQTGTWNGIIPSGVPFQIEVLRSKNSEYGTNNLKFSFYAKNYFVSGYGLLSGNGSGFNYYVSEKSSKYGLIGTFHSNSQAYSTNSSLEAQYISYAKANKKARAKHLGCLWDKGFTKTNNKVKKVAKLFNSGKWPEKVSCYFVNTPTGTIQYSGVGIATSAGIVRQDGSILFAPNHPERCIEDNDPSNPLSCSYTGKRIKPIRIN